LKESAPNFKILTCSTSVPPLLKVFWQQVATGTDGDINYAGRCLANSPLSLGQKSLPKPEAHQEQFACSFFESLPALTVHHPCPSVGNHW
jgi:hypothetical protein